MSSNYPNSCSTSLGGGSGTDAHGEPAKPVEVSYTFSRIMDDLCMVASDARSIRSELMEKVDYLVGSEEESPKECGQIVQCGPGYTGDVLREISNIKDTLGHIKHHLDRL